MSEALERGSGERGAPLRGAALMVALAVIVFPLASLSLLLPWQAGAHTPFGVTGPTLLACLLLTRRSQWPWATAGAFVGSTGAGLVAGESIALASVLALAGTAEAYASAWLMVRKMGRGSELTELRNIAWYLLFTAVCCGLAGILAGFALAIAMGGAPWPYMLFWASRDFAGMATLTTCIYALVLYRRSWRRLAGRSSWPFAVLIAVEALVFFETRQPLTYLIVAALLLVTWRTGILGAAVGVLVTLVAAVTSTLLELGPFALMPGTVGERLLALQLFLAVCFFLTVPVAFQTRRAQVLQDKLGEALAAARSSEARYRVIAEHMIDIVAQLDRDGRITYISPSCEALGYAPEEMIGRHASEFVHPDDAERQADNIALSLSGVRDPTRDRRYRIRLKDGSYRWHQGNPGLILDESGAVVGLVNTLRDVHDSKALEDRLRDAQRKADAAAKTKAEFLADMSHELRGPLNSIMGFARLAGGRPGVTALVRSYLERIEDASRNLIRMVNDILDFSKLEASAVAFRPRPVAVSELARSALALLEPQARAKNVELVLSDRAPAGLTVWLDEGWVRQVLVNLLDNAVKFTHVGRVTLLIRYEVEKQRLCVEVRDTGPGIPASRLDRLFHRFTQISDDDGERAYAGAGLGLAISKGIVEGMGGEIKATSNVGRGSCFSFWTPAPPAAEAAQEADEAAPRFRLLVADSDAASRELVASMLAPLNAEVLSAADGDAALTLAAREPLDVIVVDLELPKSGGHAALRRLRSRRGRNAATPVLALANTDDETLHARVVEEGFDGLIVKPFTAPELISAIAHAVAITSEAA